MKDENSEDLKAVQLLVLDFDGVLTDNRVFVDENGTESVLCNRSDSLGIELLKQKKNIDTIVISKEKNNVVKTRCAKLSIECYSGVDDKLGLLKSISADKNIPLKNIAYIGNDFNDVPCMKNAGVSVAVNDSHETAISVADILLNKKGGYGAVREFIDMLLAQ